MASFSASEILSCSNSKAFFFSSKLNKSASLTSSWVNLYSLIWLSTSLIASSLASSTALAVILASSMDLAFFASWIALDSAAAACAAPFCSSVIPLDFAWNSLAKESLSFSIWNNLL